MKHKIQLIGFDGTNYWRLFFVEVHDDLEVYYGLVNKKTPLSFSRHGKGDIHTKIGRQTIALPKEMEKFYKRVPLKNLDSLENFGTFVIKSKGEFSEEEYKKYISKKYNGVFLLDLREVKGTLNLSVAIAKPKNKEEIMKGPWLEKGCQVFIYTASCPWVVFYVLDVK